MTKREALSIIANHIANQLKDATVADITGYRTDELTEADHARLVEAITDLWQRTLRLVVPEHLDKQP